MQMLLRSLPFALLAFSTSPLVLADQPSSHGPAATLTPDLKQIMANPDWIGRPVDSIWWQLDGQHLIYTIQRSESDRTDWVELDLSTGGERELDATDRAILDGPLLDLNSDQTLALTLRDGNVFLRDLSDGELRQLTGDGRSQTARFDQTGQRVHVLAAGQWVEYDLSSRLARPVAALVFDDSPLESPSDALGLDQLRLFSVLDEQLAEQQAAQQEAIDNLALDPNLPPVPWYLGDEFELDFSDISADGQWLLAVVSNPGPSTGRTDVMPRFVTQSGYVEAEDVRRLVGRNANEPQQLWLLDLTNRARYPIDLTTLSGLSEDPLADLKAVESIEPHSEEDPRPLRVIGLDWHPEHNTAAIMLRAIDNKDRWLVTLDTTDRKLVERHRLTDAAWINWSFNQFGWIPGQAATPALWLLSEQTGYSHLYTIDLARNRLRQRTDGDFEVFDIQWSLDGRTVWMLSNRSHPTEYDLYRLTSTDRNMQRLTELRGLESYQLHPLTQQVAIRFSRSYLPAQAGVLDAGHQQLMVQTDTRTDNYRAIEWQLPQIVGIESKHGAERAIWSKFYPARDHLAPDQLRPAVLFVHGAGYLQNTHHRYPAYFREQMFHNLLTAKGYHVLDMDFRASRGYGRDWRTAIYRQMGTPELEDLLDGVQWLVDQHNVDPARIGVYGGSYGGFMAFMAMFKAPKVFAAGAALRPVTDWTHYNHGYTSNILNTPQIDPEAYRRSSPIEFAEHLEGHLLISHGMLDDNVFYKDSVRLAQRLIELEKEHWELASYPMEPHGYIQPSSWLDQYRRILSLFETTIGPAHSSPQPAR